VALSHPSVQGGFVLDFVNKREEMQEAVKTYYEGAEMGEEVDPARMYQLKAKALSISHLAETGVLHSRAGKV
jgi:type I site-specific restriction-modification system R (restriction) subunit